MRDFREQNYYELLEVKPQASSQEVEKSYQRARRFFDSESVAPYALFEADDLNLLRRRIEEAYRVLSDNERRKQYDSEMLSMQGAGWAGEQGSATSQHRQGDQEAVARLELEKPEEGPAWTPPSTPSETSEQIPPPEFAIHSMASRPEAETQEVEMQEVVVETALVLAAQLSVGEQTPPGTEDGRLEAEPALPPKPQAPTLPEVTQDTEYTGELLRQIREAKMIPLERIADTTKIGIYYLKMIEKERYYNLPAEVYVRGYLRQIAQLLGLNPMAVSRSYLERMGRSNEPKVELLPQGKKSA